MKTGKCEPSEITKIIELDKNNVPIQTICQIIQRPSYVVKNWIKKSGTLSEKYKLIYLQKQLARKGEKKCGFCKKIKNLNNFYQSRTTCIPCSKKCRAKQNNDLANNQNVIKILKHKLSRSRETSQRKKIKIDMDLKYLLNIFELSNGKCCYSGLPMSLSTRNKYCLSIDRIDSSLGYVKGNVCLCCSCINYMKKDTSKEEFLSLCAAITKHLN